MQTLADTFPPALMEPVRSLATESAMVHLLERAPQRPALCSCDGVKAVDVRNVDIPSCQVIVLPSALPLPPVLPEQPPTVKITGVELRFPDSDVHVTVLGAPEAGTVE
jgi:hypothetical protein